MSRATRVCIITSSHPPTDTRIFKKEGRSLVQAGFEVFELAPVADRKQIMDGITILGFGKIKNRWLRVVNFVSMLDKARLLKAFVYHVHEPELLLILPILKSFMPGAKFVYDVHENYDYAILSNEKVWIPGWLKPVLSMLINKFEKILSRLCDLIVAAGPDIEARFSDHNIISIRNYAPTEIIDNALKHKRCSRKKELHIVYIGSITRTRGILEVLNALVIINRKHSVRLIVSGIYRDSALQKEVVSEPGYRYMDYLGFLPKYENAVERAVQADMAILCFLPDPNLDTAVERSNKLFEYMAMGLPIVVSNIPQWAELVEKHQCGVVVNASDPSDIARGVSYLAENEERRIAMGRKGREAALKYYRWEIEGQRLVKEYMKLLNPDIA